MDVAKTDEIKALLRAAEEGLSSMRLLVEQYRSSRLKHEKPRSAQS